MMPSKTLSVLETRKHEFVATPSRAREHLEHLGTEQTATAFDVQKFKFPTTEHSSQPVKKIG
jgi:hypothetical protein